MAEVLGINGKGLGIDDHIYNDMNEVGDKSRFLLDLRAGMYDDLEPDELTNALVGYGITADEYEHLKAKWAAENNLAAVFRPRA